MAVFPIQQHYIPQFLLRQFSAGNRGRVHVLDKQDGRVFSPAVKKVAAQRGFYNVPQDITRKIVEKVLGKDHYIADEYLISLEPALGRMESEAAGVIDNIVRNESLSELNEQDRVILALFATLQYLRVPRQRDLYAQVNDALRQHIGSFIEKEGEELESELRRLGLGKLTPSQEAQWHLEHLMLAPDYLPFFLQKTWLLQRVPVDEPLYIGDDPVTVWNHGPRGNASSPRGFGIGTLKSEIALPLSPRLCLVMLCPSILAEFKAKLQMLDQLSAAGFCPDPVDVAPARALVQAAEAGLPLDLSADNVTHFNSRQVRASSRYVYASNGEFTLARQMLADDPQLRSGPRLEIG